MIRSTGTTAVDVHRDQLGDDANQPVAIVLLNQDREPGRHFRREVGRPGEMPVSDVLSELVDLIERSYRNGPIVG